MSDITIRYQERQTIHENSPRGPVSRVGSVDKERVFSAKDKKAAIEFIKTHTMGNGHGHDADGNYRPTITEVIGLKKEEYAPKAPAISGGKKAAHDVVHENGQQSHSPASESPVAKAPKKRGTKKAK